MASLEAERRRAFEDRVVGDLCERLPDQRTALGEDGVRQAVRDGIARAEANGLKTEVGVTAFVRLCFAFGLGFDEEHAWARSALDDRTAVDELTRVARLGKAAERYLEELLGARPAG